MAVRDPIIAHLAAANAAKSIDVHCSDLLEARTMDREDTCGVAGVRVWSLIRTVAASCGLSVMDIVRSTETRDPGDDDDGDDGDGSADDSVGSGEGWVARAAARRRPPRGGGGGRAGGGPLRVRRAPPTFAAAHADAGARGAARAARGRVVTTVVFINPEIVAGVQARLVELQVGAAARARARARARRGPRTPRSRTQELRPDTTITLARVLASSAVSSLFTEWTAARLAQTISGMQHRRRAGYAQELRLAARMTARLMFRLLTAVDASGRRYY